LNDTAADQAKLAAQQLTAQAVQDQIAAAQAAQSNVLLQNNIQLNIVKAVHVHTVQDQFAYAKIVE